MPQSERKQVWAGEKRATSGGLTKSDLVLNKRGKLVSKKKSLLAKSKNNLGDWLRKKGDKFDPPKRQGAQKAPKKRKVPAKPAAKIAAAPQKRKKEAVAPSSPSKPGQDRNLRKLTVGNIIYRKRRTGINTASWPEWAKKLSKSKQQQVSRWRKDAVSWRDIKSRV